MSGLAHPVRPGGLSPTDHEQIFSLADGGLPCSQIARRLEKHPATVRWFMYRNGLVSPGRPTAMRADPSGKAVRKRYTGEEDAFIQVLRCQSYNLAEIARLTTARFGHPRSRHSIEMRLVMLAAKEDAP